LATLRTLDVHRLGLGSFETGLLKEVQATL